MGLHITISQLCCQLLEPFECIVKRRTLDSPALTNSSKLKSSSKLAMSLWVVMSISSWEKATEGEFMVAIVDKVADRKESVTIQALKQRNKE